MFRRLRNIWRPENFQLQHMIGRGTSCFEGWYFKLVDADGAQPYAIIPGVFLGADAHAFIQVLDGAAGESTYHRFPLSEFHADEDNFEVRIGRSSFSRSGICLDIAPGDTDCDQEVSGKVHFGKWRGWPVTLSRPGVMGPYRFIPFMECNHGILSLDHGLSGNITVEGSDTNLDGGKGYCEKDWGRSFPRGYLWAQSNHFAEPGVSVIASVARIPWMGSAFRGHIICLLLRGKLYRFTTYMGSQLENIAIDDHRCELVVLDKRFRLELRASRTHGALLHAPYDKQMTERVAESMTSQIDIKLENGGQSEVIFEGSGRHGCLEVQGDLDAILHD
jgi:hypothetical protein